MVPPECSPSSAPTFKLYDVVTSEDVLHWIEAAVWAADTETYEGDYDERESRGRIARFNKIYGGMIVEVERKESQNCSHSLRSLYPSCRLETQDTTPYGSRLPDNLKNKDNVFVNVCPPYTFVQRSQRHTAFYPMTHVFPFARGFIPMMFSLNTYYRLIDARTSSASLKFAVFNGERNLFTSVAVTFDFSLGGRIDPSIRVQTIQEPAAAMWPILGVCWGAVAVMAAQFLFRIGHSLHRKTFLDLLCISQILEGLNVALFFGTALLYLTHRRAMDNRVACLSSDQRGCINTFDDEIMFETVMTNTQHINDAMVQIIEQILFVQEQSEYLQYYFSLQGLVLCIGLLRLFSFFQFQPRLAMVTQTLVDAASDLMHFLLVWAEITALYSVAGNLLFGTQVHGFESIWASIRTLFGWQLGAFDTTTLYQSYPELGPIFFMTYIIFVFLILVNIFLAIVMSAWQELYDLKGDEDGNTIYAQLAMLARHFASIALVKVQRLRGQPPRDCADATFTERKLALRKVQGLCGPDHRKVSLLVVGFRLRSVELPAGVVRRMLHEQLRRASSKKPSPNAIMLKMVAQLDKLQAQVKALQKSQARGRSPGSRSSSTSPLQSLSHY